MPTHATDHALIAACRRGDRASWEELVRRYQRLIYSTSLRCGLSADEAADVFQTVCLRLFESLERLRSTERLAAWIATTTSRESWRVKEAARRAVPVSQLGADEGLPERETPDAQPLPEEVLEQFEAEGLVRRALDELAERCRNLLTLLYYTDPVPAYADIAHRMEMPEGSIGPTRARCLQSLKKILVGLGF